MNKCKFYDERQGLVHNYSKKEGVLCKRALVLDAPAWVYEKEKLWNNVDKFEDSLALKFKKICCKL
ncbi:MAG: MobA/MobL family protein [Rickettsiales endosymbiont of Dermacentor nuttalli]